MTREVLPQKSPPPEAAGLAPTLQEVNGETQPQVCICFAGRNEIHAPFACNMCCPNLEKKKNVLYQNKFVFFIPFYKP